MRIVCPACAATYDVPEGRLVPGRVVRCARCATDWAPVAERPVVEQPEVATEPKAPPEPPPATDVDLDPVPVEIAPMPEAVAAGPAQRAWLLMAAWAMTAVILVAAGWFAFSARDAVMRTWPPSIRAYAALGLLPKH